MTKQQSSYRQIMKATSIFGGVQVINIIISIIRSKFIAALLGPTGIGISGMLTSTIGIISALTNFGLGTSAVKDISSAYQSNNPTRISIIVGILKRWIWITGLLGLISTLVFSPLLSYLCFQNWDYTYAFMLLSITLLVNQLNIGQLVILQGSRKLSFLAQANIIGNILGLLTTIPFYYLWGINGIVPALLISSIIAFVISSYFRKKINIEKIKISKARNYAEGKLMLKMGFLISMSGFITLGFSYLVRLYINLEGGLKDVGFYTAGFAIINTYVGIIFTAMGTDYFPRLSANANNQKELNKTINQQAEISLLVLTPIIITFIIFIKWIIELLYTHEFEAIDTMLVWAAAGMVFKSASWSIGYIFLAKGTPKSFFLNEIVSNIYMFILNIAGYYYFGLTGLGLSFLLAYILHLFQMILIASIQYKFKFTKKFIPLFLIQIILTFSSIFIYFNTTNIMYYSTGICILIISIAVSLYEMDKRIGLKNSLRKILKK